MEGSASLARMSVPVAMVPRAWATDDALRERREAFERGAVLSHWAAEVSGAGGHAKFGARDDGFVPVELTSLQESLL